MFAVSITRKQDDSRAPVPLSAGGRQETLRVPTGERCSLAQGVLAVLACSSGAACPQRGPWGPLGSCFPRSVRAWAPLERHSLSESGADPVPGLLEEAAARRRGCGIDPDVLLAKVRHLDLVAFSALVDVILATVDHKAREVLPTIRAMASAGRAYMSCSALPTLAREGLLPANWALFILRRYGSPRT